MGYPSHYYSTYAYNNGHKRVAKIGQLKIHSDTDKENGYNGPKDDFLSFCTHDFLIKKKGGGVFFLTPTPVFTKTTLTKSS